MASMRLPPGFRFHPTDVELVMYYLKRKLLGKKFHFEAISELNIYKYSPWDLPDKSCLNSKDLEWYFFCPRERKYASGARMNRATESGFWKTTGKDRAVLYNDNKVGMVKTLVFHRGHAPHGERTNWVIHEYRIVDDAGISQDSHVLCKVFQKNGLGPKNGAQYGAPFKEEEWDDDVEDCGQTFPSCVSAAGTSAVLAENPSSSVVTSKDFPESTSRQSLLETGPSSVGLTTSLGVPDDDINHLFASFDGESTVAPDHNDYSKMLASNQRGITVGPCSDRIDSYPDLGGLSDWPDGISFSATQETGYALNPMFYPDAFLELNDLETPLNSSAAINWDECMPMSTNSTAMYGLHSNVESLCHGVNPLGMNQYHSGSGSEIFQGNGAETGMNPLYDASCNLGFTGPDENPRIGRGIDRNRE